MKLLIITLVAILSMPVVNGAQAAGQTIIEQGAFNKISLQTVCVDGYLFSIIRINSQIAAAQVYRPGTEDDNYRPQPITCKK